MEGRLLLDVVVRKGPAVLELLAGENETLLVRRNALLVLNLLEGGAPRGKDGRGRKGAAERGGDQAASRTRRRKEATRVGRAECQQAVPYAEPNDPRAPPGHIPEQVQEPSRPSRARGRPSCRTPERETLRSRPDRSICRLPCLLPAPRCQPPAQARPLKLRRAVCVVQVGGTPTNLGLDVVDGVRGLHLQGDRLAGEGLNKDLHLEDAQRTTRDVRDSRQEDSSTGHAPLTLLASMEERGPGGEELQAELGRDPRPGAGARARGQGDSPRVVDRITQTDPQVALPHA